MEAATKSPRLRTSLGTGSDPYCLQGSLSGILRSVWEWRAVRLGQPYLSSCWLLSWYDLLSLSLRELQCALGLRYR